MVSVWMNSIGSGLFTSRTVDELLWGYDDPLLARIATIKDVETVFGLMYKARTALQISIHSFILDFVIYCVVYRASIFHGNTFECFLLINVITFGLFRKMEVTVGNLYTTLGRRTTWIMATLKHGKAKGSLVAVSHNHTPPLCLHTL